MDAVADATSDAGGGTDAELDTGPEVADAAPDADTADTDTTDVDAPDGAGDADAGPVLPEPTGCIGTECFALTCSEVDWGMPMVQRTVDADGDLVWGESVFDTPGRVEVLRRAEGADWLLLSWERGTRVSRVFRASGEAWVLAAEIDDLALFPTSRVADVDGDGNDEFIGYQGGTEGPTVFTFVDVDGTVSVTEDREPRPEWFAWAWLPEQPDGSRWRYEGQQLCRVAGATECERVELPDDLYATSWMARDLDGDGWTELIWGADGQLVSVELDAPEVTQTVPWGGRVSNAVAVDVDGDSVLELVDVYAGEIVDFHEEGGARDVAVTLPALHPWCTDYGLSAVMDWDGDGADDALRHLECHLAFDPWQVQEVLRIGTLSDDRASLALERAAVLELDSAQRSFRSPAGDFDDDGAMEYAVAYAWGVRTVSIGADDGLVGVGELAGALAGAAVRPSAAWPYRTAGATPNVGVAVESPGSVSNEALPRQLDELEVSASAPHPVARRARYEGSAALPSPFGFARFNACHAQAELGTVTCLATDEEVHALGADGAAAQVRYVRPALPFGASVSLDPEDLGDLRPFVLDGELGWLGTIARENVPPEVEVPEVAGATDAAWVFVSLAPPHDVLYGARREPLRRDTIVHPLSARDSSLLTSGSDPELRRVFISRGEDGSLSDRSEVIETSVPLESVLLATEREGAAGASVVVLDHVYGATDGTPASQYRLFVADESGVLQLEAWIETDHPWSMETLAADWDGDGIAEWLLTGRNPDSTSIVELRLAPEPSLAHIGEYYGSASPLAVFDVNADGVADVLMANELGNVGVLEGRCVSE